MRKGGFRAILSYSWLPLAGTNWASDQQQDLSAIVRSQWIVVADELPAVLWNAAG
jgi:hypothetical protein